jgi:hypothetical protein
MRDLMKEYAAQFGVLPLYAVIIAVGSPHREAAFAAAA